MCNKSAFPTDSAKWLDEMRRRIDAAENAIFPATTEDARFRVEHRPFGYIRMSFLCPFTNYLLGSQEDVINAMAECEARRAITESVLSVERFRRKYGTTPDSLSELVPEFVAKRPVDPFTGEPMITKRTAQEFLIYSVGRNRRDDGGDVGGDLPKDIVCKIRIEK